MMTVPLETSQARPSKYPDTDATTASVMKYDFRPIHGILSMHHRKQAETWNCLVCGASQSLTNQTCLTCNRERIPPWLLDVHGCAVVPGSIVKCSRGSARYVPPPSGLPPGAPGTTTPPRNKSRSPPKSPQPASPRTPRAGASSGTTTLPGSPGRSTGAIGRRYPATRQNPSPSPSPVRSGRRGIADNNRRSGAVSPANSLSTRNAASPTAAAAADVVVPTSPQQPRRTAYSPKPNKTANKNSATSPGGGDVRSPRREKKGRAEVAFEAVTAAIKRNFEAQPGDRMVMVVGVNGFRPQSTRAPPRSVEGYCIVEGDDCQATSRVLVKVVIDMTKVTSIEVMDPSRASEEHHKFLGFGLCGRCERIYRVDQGWKHVSDKSVEEWESNVHNLSELAVKTEERKAALRAARSSRRTDILEASASLKRIYNEIATIRRTLEPVVMSCPFCLWDGSPLFTAPAAGDGEREGERPELPVSGGAGQ